MSVNAANAASTKLHNWNPFVCSEEKEHCGVSEYMSGARKPYPSHRRWWHMNYLPRVALAPSFALLPCRSTLFLPSTADDDGKTGSSAGTKSTTTNGSTGESSNTNRKCEDINHKVSAFASPARTPPFPPSWRGTWTCTGLRWRPSTTTRFLSSGNCKWGKHLHLRTPLWYSH